ncbi:glycosyltransferase [Alloalcanivorax sp. C16-1]|uniref:glycosyltransferase n=1 Tax=Alloalcanivorax sp. C16-1 TaxID=3390051 RepID=UPI00397107CF
MSDMMTDSPVVTFALFAYNQERFIREAVEGAFSQTHERLEIILSDDCSTDRTFEIMTAMVSNYQGGHHVTLRRNKKNIGLASHVNLVLEHSRGDIVLMAAGDDVSLPSRAAISVEIFRKNPKAMAVMLSADVIDDNGDIVGRRLACGKKKREVTQNIDHLLSWRHATFGATRAIRKSVFEEFGPLKADCPTEDTPFLMRSLICGDNILSPQKGVLYRRHNANLSGVRSLLEMNVDAIYKQYDHDVRRARKNGLLTGRSMDSLLSWMPRDRRVREIRLKILSKTSVSFADILFCSTHPAFSFKDKLNILVSFFCRFGAGKS